MGLVHKLSSPINNNCSKSGILYTELQLKYACGYIHFKEKKNVIWSLKKAVLALIGIVATGKIKYRTDGHFW